MSKLQDQALVAKWRSIEQKWQDRWLASKAFRAANPNDPHFDSQRKPFYVLDMFPYPSGSGLHVGHSSGYLGTDIVARRMWMKGYNVLHPMGWDAFGLPAEQYAIQTGQHPRVTTDQNTAMFRRQLRRLGISYDWDREIDTSDPNYYRWTQWLFLQMYKKGLVYRKEMMVWWCEELKTVLANEEVIGGRSERGNYPCERRPLTQWLFRITEYADRLLSDLEELDWPEPIKKMQRDWIGRSEGAIVKFPLADSSGQKVEIFTTRLDTLMGVVAVVLAPEHPLIKSKGWEEHREVRDFLKQVAGKSERDRKTEAGHGQMHGVFVGQMVVHPVTGEKIPVWIADYVLVDYGTGAVMCVPAHDERDYIFAKKYQLPLKRVINPENIEQVSVNQQQECFVGPGVLVESGIYTGLSSDEAKTRILEDLKKKDLAERRVSYKLRDWIFSRQRYWGEPFPLLLTEEGDVILVEEVDLPVTLPPMKDFEPSSDGSSPLARVKDWVEVKTKDGRILRRVTDTMPGWAGSCWYYLRFMDPHNHQAPFSQEAVNYWRQVDLYVGGASHAVMHLLYARFWHKVLYDLGLVPTKEPFKRLFNQGTVTAFGYRDQVGRLIPADEVKQDGSRWIHVRSGCEVERFVCRMSKSLRNVVNPDEMIEKYGCDSLRLYQMFMAPLADDKPWDEEGMVGCYQFLKRWWNHLVQENGELKPLRSDSHPDHWRALHKCLKRVNDSFQEFNFNTAVAAFMECFNDIKKVGEPLSREQLAFWLKVMHPFIPHLTQEIWFLLGNSTFLHLESWPESDSRYLETNQFELVLQINGKLKKRRMTPKGLSQEKLQEMALQELQNYLKGVNVKKIIVVPDRLVNVVVE